jgi:cobalt/nickel transport system permease protein
MAAIVAGIEFGIQPLLAHDAAGRALYSPFGLHIAVPAMALEHLLVFGLVEGMATALVVAYFQRTAPEMLGASGAVVRKPVALVPRIAIGLAILALLAPIGLFLPAHFHAGSAWGEWSADEIEQLVGYRPAAFKRSEPWSAPMPDYAPKGQENAGLRTLSISYIVSGVAGAVVVVLAAWGLGKLLAAKEGSDAS